MGPASLLIDEGSQLLRRVEGHASVHTRREFAPLCEIPVHYREVLHAEVKGLASESGNAHIVHHRHAVRQSVGGGALDVILLLLKGGNGLHRANQSNRRILKQARGTAPLIPLNDAPLWVRGRRIDLGQGQCDVIHQNHVAVRATQEDGVRGRDLVDPLRARQPLRPVGELVLVPAAAHEPLPLGEVLGRGGHAPHELGLGRDAAQVQRRQKGAAHDHVRVGVHKAGEAVPPAQVHLRVAKAGLRGGGVVARPQDPAVQRNQQRVKALALVPPRSPEVAVVEEDRRGFSLLRRRGRV
mmetsp:Transcript_8844/g.22650  ORF Transcript_8844/g.22650 Transcript_8844/m.22650 type:complete len:297 (+) Transcript_8844:787-1677(+)